MTDTTAADRQARHRARAKAAAEAKLAGATEIPIAWFGVNRQGVHVAIGYDNKLIELKTFPDYVAPVPVLSVAPAPTPTEVEQASGVAVKTGPKIVPEIVDSAHKKMWARYISTKGAERHLLIEILEKKLNTDPTPSVTRDYGAMLDAVLSTTDSPDWVDELGEVES